MDFESFIKDLNKVIPVGTVLDNPGGGTSTIRSITEKNIRYQRKNSVISVKKRDLFDALIQFEGKRVTTTDLKGYSPSAFDSKLSGHNCNGTFLFMILNRFGLIDGIQGEGKSGDPFWTDFPKLSKSNKPEPRRSES